MRVFFDAFAADPQALDQFFGACTRGCVTDLGFMRLDGLGQVIKDALHRVERGHRVLKNHANLGTANIGISCRGNLHQIPSVKP